MDPNAINNSDVLVTRDPNDPGFTDLPDITASVTASTTSMTPEAKVAIMHVTGIAPAQSDTSGLKTVSYQNAVNLLTKAQKGVTASVQTTLLPDLSGCNLASGTWQAITSRYLYWSDGSAGATSDFRSFACDNAAETLLRVSCGSSSASATVWIVQMNLSAPQTVPVDDGHANGNPNIPDYAVSNSPGSNGIPTDDDLRSMAVSVVPNGLPAGNVQVQVDSSLQLCYDMHKVNGLIQPPDWDLSQAKLPRLLWLEGVNSCSSAQIEETYSWGDFSCSATASCLVTEENDKASIRVFTTDYDFGWQGYENEKYGPLGGCAVAVLELHLAAGESVANNNAILRIADQFAPDQIYKDTGDQEDASSMISLPIRKPRRSISPPPITGMM